VGEESGGHLGAAGVVDADEQHAGSGSHAKCLSEVGVDQES
jgi:hypothetical protein